jgi:hypothetical protein
MNDEIDAEDLIVTIEDERYVAVNASDRMLLQRRREGHVGFMSVQ